MWDRSCKYSGQNIFANLIRITGEHKPYMLDDSRVAYDEITNILTVTLFGSELVAVSQEPKRDHHES
jgi:hypothetical protein